MEILKSNWNSFGVECFSLRLWHMHSRCSDITSLYIQSFLGNIWHQNFKEPQKYTIWLSWAGSETCSITYYSSKSYLHLHHTSLTLVQNGVQYSAASIFNKLPKEFRKLSCNPCTFRSELKSCLTAHCFYSVEGLRGKKSR